MYRNTHIQRHLMTAVLAVTLLVIAIPMCQMIGCSMDMSRPMSMLGMGTSGLPTATGQCDGFWVTSSGFSAVMPGELESLVLGLVGLIVAVAVMLGASSSTRLPAVQRAGPPPPPLDPRGERLTI